MAKVSKDSVNYRPATNSKRCGNCSMFIERQYADYSDKGRCTLVEGLIRIRDTCDKWVADK
jgi:hypothetical protein